MPKFSKGHISRKINWFNQVIYSSSPISWPSFKTLACTVHKIWHASDFMLILSKGHNSRKEDNSDKKKKRVSAIFPRGIHTWSFKTLACTVFDERTHARTDNPKPICSRNFFEVGGHNKSKRVKQTFFTSTLGNTHSYFTAQNGSSVECKHILSQGASESEMVITRPHS